jgi:hypothetical protein
MLTEIKQANKQMQFQISALQNTETYILRLTNAHA